MCSSDLVRQDERKARLRRDRTAGEILERSNCPVVGLIGKETFHGLLTSCFLFHVGLHLCLGAVRIEQAEHRHVLRRNARLCVGAPRAGGGEVVLAPRVGEGLLASGFCHLGFALASGCKVIGVEVVVVAPFSFISFASLRMESPVAIISSATKTFIPSTDAPIYSCATMGLRPLMIVE